MTIEVTPDDLKQGWDWSWGRIKNIKDDKIREKKLELQCYNCPVATALNRIFKTKNSIAEYYRLTINGVVHRTPEVVSDWMGTFDYALPVEPFSFELEINEQAIKGT